MKRFDCSQDFAFELLDRVVLPDGYLGEIIDRGRMVGADVRRAARWYLVQYLPRADGLREQWFPEVRLFKTPDRRFENMDERGTETNEQQGGFVVDFKFRIGTIVRIDLTEIVGKVVAAMMDRNGGKWVTVEWVDKTNQLHSNWFALEEVSIVEAEKLDLRTSTNVTD